MWRGKFMCFVVIILQVYGGVRISFSSCQSPGWSCGNSLPSDVVYSCTAVASNDFVIHLKDYHTNHIRTVTIKNCKNVRVILDCQPLPRPSQLQQFIIKDCGRVEFVTTSEFTQTPPEMILENIREITSLPRNMFKSPKSNTELRCLGSNAFKIIRVANSKINSINTKAIYNVTNIKYIQFENVTVTDIQNGAIEAMMSQDNSMFSIINSNIDNVNSNGIAVQSASVKVSGNTFGRLTDKAFNISTDNLYISGNSFREINANGLWLKSVSTYICNNYVDTLKSNALAGVRCASNRRTNKMFNFSRNEIKIVQPHSLLFDYASCQESDTQIIFKDNKIDCLCRNIAFLNSTGNNGLHGLILDVKNNNTCLVAPCILPVEVIKLLLESDMCQINLDPQVMCLIYNDKHGNKETTIGDVATEPPTFYLIRQANSQNRDASAAMTAMDKDNILNGKNLNVTNRTTIKVVFDSSMDFVETLRSISSTKRRPDIASDTSNNEYVNRCVGPRCRTNVAYDKQKALDFYKYIYSQLRPPKPTDRTKK